MEPTVVDFQQFFKENVNLDIEHTLLLSSLIQEIENPFRNGATYHKFNKWLITKLLLYVQLQRIH